MADIGCGDQPYRHLFKQVTTFYGVDKSADSKADVIADVHEIPFKDSTLDALLATEILEHVSDPSKVMGEISRVLKPNGVLLLTVPFFWGLHQEPFDYYRYTKYGLQYLSEKNGLEVLEVVPKCGFWATWTQRLIDNVIEVYMRNCSAWSTYTVTALFAPVSAGGYLLDSLIGCRGDSLGNTLVARKPPSARPEKV